jgi:hypothetical protein
MAPVKLLMSWDIIPGREQEYFEFVVREFVPGIQRLGIEPTEAWLTTYGKRPQILTGGVAEDYDRMRWAQASGGACATACWNSSPISSGVWCRPGPDSRCRQAEETREPGRPGSLCSA